MRDFYCVWNFADVGSGSPIGALWGGSGRVEAPSNFLTGFLGNLAGSSIKEVGHMDENDRVVGVDSQADGATEELQEEFRAPMIVIRVVEPASGRSAEETICLEDLGDRPLEVVLVDRALRALEQIHGRDGEGR